MPGERSTTTDQTIDALRRAIEEVEASAGRLVFVRLTTGEARGLVAELVRLRDQVARLTDPNRRWV